MSEHHLKIAREFIQDRDFTSARKVLNKVPSHPTAKKWLARIDEIELENATSHQPLRPVELPIRLEVIMRKHLAKDETVLWYEQPEPVIYSRYLNPNWSIAMFLIIGISLLLFHSYLQFVLTSRGITNQFLLQVAAPLIFIAAPFIRLPIAQSRATTIHYILTNRRAFIVEKLKVNPIPIPITHPSRIEIVAERAGFESIIFHRYSSWWGLFMVKIPIGFLGIGKTEDVKQIISEYWK